MEIGLDVVEIARMVRLIRNKAFLARVFSPGEVRYCRAKARAEQHFAARFAAKEAVWKALGRSGLALRSIEVISSPGGRPEARVSGRLVAGLRLSLTHADHYAAAVAIFAPFRPMSKRSERRRGIVAGRRPGAGISKTAASRRRKAR